MKYMEEKFIIQGGKPLQGEVEIRGAKNAAFPILAASILTEETCVIDNIPLIEDVFKMIKILEGLGAEIIWKSKRKIEINTSKLVLSKMPINLVGKFRGSILLIAALLSRFSQVKMPPPGGCIIGARPIDTHLDAFEQAGVKISLENNQYTFKRNSSAEKSHEIVLREISVTATLNMLLFAAFNPKKTVIKIADMDYQVQDLIKVLEKMGVSVTMIGIRELEIVGKKRLKGFNHNLISDPIEAGTFIVAALATKGTITVKNAELSYLDLFLKRLKDFGAKFKIIDSKTIKILPSKLKMDKIQSLPYPGIHSDLQPELGVLATQTKGPTLIHDPLFEGRLKYLDELNKMGADIIFCDPHRAIVYGPSQLQGIEIPSSDLRAGAAMIIAGLVAKGKTTIHNIYQIDRGYEKIEERLQGLGADIKRRIKS
jgi:UDP-N-acetylglucosamine 1-carboxyvinyltransferase